MSFTRPTLDTIYQRIKADLEARVTSGVQIPRVSLLGILDIVFAGAIHLCYGFLAWVSRQVFVDTADDDIGLERWGNILGLPRKPATFSTGLVAPTGTASTVVVAGTIVLNSEGYEFETQDDYTIGVSDPVEAVAVEEGSASNHTDSVMTLASPLPDVDTDVPVVSGFDNGEDQESRDNWVLRLLQRFQNPPSSGSASDYVRWALEVSGVGKAWCFGGGDWLGAGTVGVFVATEDLEEVSTTVLDDVEEHIEELRPLTASISYLNIDPLTADFDISLTPNTPELRSAVSQNLTDLFILNSEPGGTILLSQMRSAIGATGPDDYEITEIYLDGVPNGVANIDTVKPKTPRFGVAIYSSL